MPLILWLLCRNVHNPIPMLGSFEMFFSILIFNEFFRKFYLLVSLINETLKGYASTCIVCIAEVV